MSNVNEKTLTFDLGLETMATLNITRIGQQYPQDGNGVISQLKLSLPAITNKDFEEKRVANLSCVGTLHFDLRFDTFVGGETLKYHNWGSLDDNLCYRSIYKDFVAPTWEEAFSKAETYGKEEIQKLLDKIQERKEALEYAETGKKKASYTYDALVANLFATITLLKEQNEKVQRSKVYFYKVNLILESILEHGKDAILEDGSLEKLKNSVVLLESLVKNS